jgi:RNA polymerase sigma factor (sigma-70 family)
MVPRRSRQHVNQRFVEASAILLLRYMSEVPTKPAADLALVRRVLARDPSATEELGRRLSCVTRILSALNGRLGRPFQEHDVADLVQDTQRELLQQMHGYSGQGVLEAWVFRFCELKLCNALRKLRRVRQLEVPEDAPDQAAAREWKRLLDREACEAALTRLGGAEAEVLRLRYYEELDWVEIADRLGTKPAAVKARYYRGLEKLVELFGIDRSWGGA